MYQIARQYTLPRCRDILKDMSIDKYKYRLRRTLSSASREFRNNELESFIFLNEKLFKHIDFGVIYILDHPFCSASGTPTPGDHRYIYFSRTQSPSESQGLPRVHFRRLATVEYARGNKSVVRRSKVSTGLRYD
jgi:hypothetical protein